jgi:hypothetical protein
MLTINNIQKLNNKSIGVWRVAGVEIDYQRTSQSPDHSYTIRLSRSGAGAAIVIEREAGQFGYNVSICYEDYDNVISITPWPKDRLLNKNNFLASMQGILDAEYDKRK